MTNPVGFEGQINIDIYIEDGALQPYAVNIRSSRPTDITRIFHGKSIDETLQLVPLVFSVCSRAQLCASVRAIEKAQGITAHPQVEVIRDALVIMETICEHLWRILLDWPTVVDTASDHAIFAEVKRLAKEYEWGVCGNHNYFAPGALPQRTRGDEIRLKKAVAGLIEIIESRILKCETHAWLEIFGFFEFHEWLRTKNTATKAFIRYILDNRWQKSGHCDSVALTIASADDEALLHREMECDTFIRAPEWQGECRETNSSARVESPLLYALKKEYGKGLLTRVIARLTELVMLTQHLIPGSIHAEITMGQVPKINIAIGKVNAARGQLLHRVALQGTYVKRYQILAPTEWNFHPRGVVARALVSLKGTRGEILQQAKLFVEAVDPCVGYQIQALVTEQADA